MIDASKLGEEYKEGNNQKRRLRDFEIDRIVNTFQNKEAVDDFSVAVTYDEIKEKGYSLSAGQYFDIKIDYVDITEEEFNARMDEYKRTLAEQFAESRRLEAEIMRQLDTCSSITLKNKHHGKRNTISTLQYARRKGQSAGHHQRRYDLVYPKGNGSTIWGWSPSNQQTSEKYL